MLLLVHLLHQLDLQDLLHLLHHSVQDLVALVDLERLGDPEILMILGRLVRQYFL